MKLHGGPKQNVPWTFPSTAPYWLKPKSAAVRREAEGIGAGEATGRRSAVLFPSKSLSNPSGPMAAFARHSRAFQV
jgi:hypothetical protein